MNTIIPAQLWTGNALILRSHVEKKLKESLCLHGFKDNHCFCSSCKNIEHRQHHLVHWISPETGYTVEDLASVIQRSSFELEENQNFFFIFEKAHTLTTATANRLLKLLEEPPRGYHFILLASTAASIISTIRSRCALFDLSQGSSPTIPSFLKQFITLPFNPDVVTFESELQKNSPHESETSELLSILLGEIHSRYKESSSREDQAYYKFCIAHLNNHMNYLPQSGSSTLFWKHFFLTFPQNINV